MDRTEKIIVRLTPDTIILLQKLVDRGKYKSLSEGVADAIRTMIESEFTPQEMSAIQSEHIREKPLDMESLLTDGDKVPMDEAVRKAVREYVRSRMEPEE
ncbi:MAG: ribbon-helix-helix domain-containing protein [Candidatus Methanoplasma sp.]|jgi:Arc/MetJ-type ribon-helix-helix transcriptional regulator|nr:ribbon-helix-helix domain-containing protein [Candidatus Methanoplasma sp.]